MSVVNHFCVTWRPGLESEDDCLGTIHINYKGFLRDQNRNAPLHSSISLSLSVCPPRLPPPPPLCRYDAEDNVDELFLDWRFARCPAVCVCVPLSLLSLSSFPLLLPPGRRSICRMRSTTHDRNVFRVMYEDLIRGPGYSGTPYI